MKNVGILCEYNPFHNGHARQLSLVREKGGVCVCLMSGNYVQRGEPAILDKWTRAEAALRCGADVVLELPVTYALRSAEGFAGGAVELFDRMGCVDALCFGSEEENLDKIMSTAKAMETPAFSEALRVELKKGLSFPAARQRALEAMGVEAAMLESPNAILAVEYCKALLRRGSRMEPTLIHRNGDYHGGSAPDAPSASFLRERSDWRGFVPDAALEVYAAAPRYTAAAGERAWLARLRAMEEADFARLPFGSEGLWRRVLAACRSERSVAAIAAAAKSKRYTHTRLMRMLLCAYLDISGEMLMQPAPYVRILAVSERGQSVLRRAKKEGTLPIYHTGERVPQSGYAVLERRAADLYELFCVNGENAVGRENAARLLRERH